MLKYNALYFSVVISSWSALDVFLCGEYDVLPFSIESSSSQILFSNDSRRCCHCSSLEISLDLRVGREMRHCH